MKNLIKKILQYTNSINDKNDQDLKELITYQIDEIIRINKKENNYRNLDKKKLIEFVRDLKGTSVTESLKIIESVIKTSELDGDICEFGVAQGKTSKLISYLIQNTSEKIYLYDSFEGLPDPSNKDILKDDIFNLKKIENYKGKMSHAETKVIKELKSINFNFDKLIINKGFFNKENIKNYSFPEFISFAYLDFDFYQPTIDSLEIIEKKLIKGSIIIVDDYDFFSTGAKTALDEWYQMNNKFFNLEIVKTLNSSFAIIEKI